METKALIRKQVLEMRESMSADERRKKSLVIAERVMEHPAYREAVHLLCYVSYKSEVETTALIEYALKQGKKVYCPKVHGKEMDFYRIASFTDLSGGYKGIREPQAAEELLFDDKDAKKERCLMLMPGSVFDKERGRIGYGGGYYDRYLEKHIGFITMAICFEIQIREKIPLDVHDRRPDILLTEYHTY